MNGKMVRLLRLLASPAAAVLLTVTFACNSRRADQAPPDLRELPAKTAFASVRSDPGINLQCDVQRIQSAPAPFHWSYKKSVPPMTKLDWEADVTSISITGAVTDGSGTRVIHGVRSDRTSWDTVVSILTSALPGSTFSLVNDSSAVTRAGQEDVNGQQTTKYEVDTARDTPADASLIRSVLGPSGSVKGAAWVNPQGCPVKFVLDVEQRYVDRTAHKEHYEANVTQQ